MSDSNENYKMAFAGICGAVIYGMFMNKWESTWMGLSGSAILLWRK